MGKYFDGTEIGNLATTGTGGGAWGTVTQNGNTYISPGFGGAPIAQQQAANALAQQQADLQAKNAALAAQVAQQAAAAKKLALDQAWGSNSQALNSQRSTVDNNYQSATNKLTALQSSRLPEYQAQKDATSQEAAAQLRRTQALNAMTGKFNSGYNRSQMNDVGIARQGSLDAVQGSENAFKTDVGNQMSDVERSRVAALNDIAEKLTLGQKQYNEGSLSLTNQLQSEIANGALKASMDAQTWADTQKQLGIDNSLRQAQLDQAARLAEIQQAFNEKQLTAEQANAAINQTIAMAGVTGVYNGQPTYAASQDAIANKYRYDALAASGAKVYAPKAPTATEIKQNYTAEAFNDIQKALDSGASPETVKQGLLSHSADYAQMGIPISTLISQVDAITKSWGTYGDETPKINPSIATSNAASAWNSLNNMWNR